MSDYLSCFKAITELSAGEQQAMAALYLAHYDGSSLQRFQADLAGKSEALLVYCGDELAGFTTLELYERDFAGQRLRVVYSGDTVVARAHWGQQTLAFAWISRMGELRRAAPALPLYWFLLVKGHRTFRYLPTFARSFHPHWAQDRSDLQPLLDMLANEKFGADYLPQSGLITFAQTHGHLKPEIAEPSPEDLAKPAVAFFLARNPGFRNGHELCCMCELDEANLRPLAQRLFRGSRA